MFDIDTILEELYLEFPDVDRKSINKICRHGLSCIRKYTHSGKDVYYSGGSHGAPVKFFIPMTPEDNNLRNGLYLYKKRIKAQENANAADQSHT